MARSVDTMRFYLGRLGKVGLAGALLVAGSVAYDAMVVRPRETAAANQLVQNQLARKSAEAQRARAQAEGDAGMKGQPQLAPAAAAALRRLFEAADKAGLELPQGEYRLTEVKDAHLRRYQLSLPVAGSYPEVRAFVAHALNDDPALALTAIQLRRERIENTDLDVLLNFTLFLEVGA